MRVLGAGCGWQRARGPRVGVSQRRPRCPCCLATAPHHTPACLINISYLLNVYRFLRVCLFPLPFSLQGGRTAFLVAAAEGQAGVIEELLAADPQVYDAISKVRILLVNAGLANDCCVYT